MSIPDYQSLMLPLLKQVSDGQEHSFPSLVEALAADYKLTDSERRELLPSGSQFIFDNRVGWARTYMKKAGLLSYPTRGMVQITPRGVQVLKESTNRVDNKVLRRFPEFLEFQNAKSESAREASDPAIAEQLDPQENVEAAYQQIQKQVSAELLAQIKACSPRFFERLVLELLLKMGYGGSRREVGQVIGKSGDGGVDVVIKQDKLGLEEVYVQAKRWDGIVGSSEIRNFVGALLGRKASKGFFITTSSFSKPAYDYLKDIQVKVVLINGQQLADHLIEHGVGVSSVASYEIKKVDVDYFADG